MSEPNPKIGTVKCFMGGTADVYQTKRKGKHLYMVCDCCGVNQGTKQKFQQYIWDNVDLLPSIKNITKPSNVVERDTKEGELLPAQPETTEVPTETVTESTEFNPDAEPVDDSGSDVIECKSSGIKKVFLGAGLALLSAGVGVWMS